MRSKTVKENYGYGGKVQIERGKYPNSIWIISEGGLRSDVACLSPKRARELFEAGLQMCDELEKDETNVKS